MGVSVGLRIDPRRKEPLYRQVFDEIVARIEAGTFPAGYRLPAIRELATDLSTHRNTIARAYADLEAAGFVSSTVGRGTFVEARPAGKAAARPPVGALRGSSISWSALLADRARGDSLSRAERYARAADRRDVVNLARMQPSSELFPTELLARCIERALGDQDARAMVYAPPDGLLRLREQIAEDLAHRGVPATAADILVTSGSQQGLDLLARALVNPGESVLVEATTYSGAIDLFTLAGARLIPVPGDHQGPDVGALQRWSRAEAKALYLMPNAHNPTGACISSERRREIVAWSRASGIAIIEDDYGAGLELEKRESPPHLRALDGDVIHISTFSKRLVPALRVGFVVCPAPLRAALSSMKRITDLGTSAVLQHALAEFMERGYLRAHMNRVVPEYRARRDALEAALASALPAEVRWRRPSHGVVLWLRLPSTVDPTELYEEALRQGVLVSPSPMWSVETTAEHGLRLAFCAEPPKRLVEGAKRLGKALKIVMGKKSRSSDGASRTLEVV